MLFLCSTEKKRNQPPKSKCPVWVSSLTYLGMILYLTTALLKEIQNIYLFDNMTLNQSGLWNLA